MNVSLTDKLEKFVNELVENGRYRSASEVVREGLRRDIDAIGAEIDLPAGRQEGEI